MTHARLGSDLTEAFAAGALSLRNRLINGGFDVWQRGASASVGGYLADRWNLQLGTGTVIAQNRVQPSPGQMGPGSRYGFSCNITNAGDATNGAAVLTQRIEGVDTLQGNITVSFIAATDTGVKKIGVNVTQNFGTGGSPSASVQLTPQLVTPGIVLGGTRQVVQFALPSLVGKTIGSGNNDFLEIEFYFSGGTAFNGIAGVGPQTGWFYLGQVQVEQGLIATPFEIRHVPLELLMCQRYYEVGSFNMNWSQGASTDWPFGNSSWYSTFHPYKASKRAAPTLTGAIGTTYSNLSGVWVQFNGVAGNVNMAPVLEANGVTIHMGGTSNSSWARNTGYFYMYVQGSWVANSEL